MTERSLICRLLRDHPDKWREILKEKKIKTRENGRRCILNYGMGADFSDPLVREARGIIIDTEKADVICWPFSKFGNWNEGYADNIDWENAVVQEKIDGSIIKLYFWENTWNWATNSHIDAGEARLDDEGRVFADVIRQADNYHDIPFGKLDIEKTYIFELVSPENLVVVEYPFTRLFHTGTRSNVTGREYDDDIGIVKPKVFGRGKDLEDYIKQVRRMNSDKNHPAYEGFVAVDRNWNRVKIKSPEYLALHRLLNNGNMAQDRIISAILEDDRDIKEIAARYRSNREQWEDTEEKLAALEREVEEYIGYVRGMYDEVEHDRKAVASAIKNDELSCFGFAAIGNDLSAMDILKQTRMSTIERLLQQEGERHDKKQDKRSLKGVLDRRGHRGRRAGGFDDLSR